MRAAVILAMIPMGLWASWPAPPPPIVARAVETEGVRAQRMDADLFAHRWRVVSELPPALQIHEVSNDERRVVSVDGPGARDRTVDRPSRPRIRPARNANAITVRRASLAPDICQRHRMHKVWITAKRWRCKR